MTKKNELTPQEQEQEQENNIPEFLREDKAEGMEEVSDSTNFEEIRVATKMSKVFEEGEVELGHLYNADSGEDLGKVRNMVPFVYKINYQLSNEDSSAIFCKSYDKNRGLVRVYQSEDFDQEFINGMKLTDEEMAEDGLVERACAECQFHPVNGWKTNEKGDNIPPRCKESHEIYLLDVTEGFDKTPYLIRVNNSSRLKADFLKKFNHQVNTNLRVNDISLFGGVFEFFGDHVENSRGGKNYVFGSRFAGHVKNKELYDFAKKSHKEFKKTEEARNKRYEERAKEVQVEVTDEDPDIEVADWGEAESGGDEPWPTS